MASLANVAANNDRRASLIALRDALADAIDSRPGAVGMAALCLRFQDVLSELADIDGPVVQTSKVDELRQRRTARSA